MSRWHCAVVALLAAGCVDLGRPAGLAHPIDAQVVETDGPPSSDDGNPGSPDLAVGVDAAEPDAAVPQDVAVGEDAPLVPDAATPEPDLAPPDAPLVLNGHPCATNAQCQSTICKDGICCSAACTGLCEACNVAGALGTCAPVSAGQDPDNDCPQDPVSSCGRDGTCNGQRACSRYRESTECAPGGCTGDQESAASTCNGAGACVPGKTVSCAPMMCMNGSCAKGCTQQSQCQAGFFCDGTACRPRRAPGQTCANAFECASGNCTDKVCCNTPCSESCHSCALAATMGTCTPAPAGMDPRNNCPAEPTTSCGRAGGCNGAGSCSLHPTGTPCGPGQSCTGTAQTTASACNGLGVCAAGTTTECTAYRCSGTACGTTCATAAQCKTGFACTGSACVALPAPALYWKLDETTGTAAADSSGNNLNGTYNGPTPSTMVPPMLTFPDPSSRAFVRANRHFVQLTNMPASLKVPADITLSAWYRATNLDSAGSGSEIVSGGDQWMMRLHSADLEVSKRTADGHKQCLGPVTGHLDGNWHHAAATITATAMTVYVDGVLRITCPNTLPIVYDRGNNLLVGRHGNGNDMYDFEGNIDEVRVYLRVLTGTEIAALAAGN
jgi:hypothetical protein